MEYKYPVIDVRATGEHIEEICKDNGYTPKTLCSALGLAATQSVYHWYRGRSLPSADNLYAMARLLNLHMDDFIVEAA